LRLSVRSALLAGAAAWMDGAQCAALSLFAGSTFALTVCLFIVFVSYVVSRARDGRNKSAWLCIFRVLYFCGGPAVFGLAVSYPLYLKHVYHAASIFSDTPPQMSRCFFAYGGGGGITLGLGLWWLNRQARTKDQKPTRT